VPPANNYYQRQLLDRSAAAASVQIWFTSSGQRAPGGIRSNVGSGTVIHSDGARSYILTCKHLTNGPGQWKVILAGSRQEVPAEFIAVDPRADLALIAVRYPQLPRVAVSDMNDLPVGTPVFLVGKEFREVAGSILDINQHPNGYRRMDLAMVPISGDSGGGVFTADARLVAVCIDTDG